ncbi:HAD family hydrolase [Sphingobium sp. Sx8-8]|uniref:D-glycero-alpha-D-manno-heptose-1,7-bisphosphate 7-phosphatase n=1 Tax=Sphingobium sp. Sx8-8 TaxID=2933617 RepID=UPI001F57A333|nr:HAD family hydrolase [Sphingobium sp. Sx8-8]
MTLRPALFLDRDGVINIDHGYVGDRSRFEFIPGIFALVRRARALGYLPVVVTNQSGIARGLFSEEAFFQLTEWMCDRFLQEGAPLEAVYHCPYHPEAKIERWRADHEWRKPRPGMLLAAANDLSIDLRASAIIGDKLSDMDAGRAAGLELLILVSKLEIFSPSTIKIKSLLEAEEIIFKAST